MTDTAGDVEVVRARPETCLHHRRGRLREGPRRMQDDPYVAEKSLQLVRIGERSRAVLEPKSLRHRCELALATPGEHRTQAVLQRAVNDELARVPCSAVDQ
jgi:hypothetical protein